MNPIEQYNKVIRAYRKLPGTKKKQFVGAMVTLVALVLGDQAGVDVPVISGILDSLPLIGE